MIKKLLVATALCALSFAPAQAQSPPIPPPASVICGSQTLAVTNTTGNKALTVSAPCAVITLLNDGAKEIFFKLGGSTITAATTDIPLPPAASFSFWTNQTYVAAIAGGSDTSTLRIMQANGAVAVGGGPGSSGVAGSVTQGTTPWVDNVTQWASVALGAPSAYGTSPGAVNVPGINAFVTNTVTTSQSPAARTLVTLDVKTVTTGGTAVTALSAGHRTAGGFLQNPIGALINLCINEIGTAVGTTSNGDTTCIIPGQSYIAAPSADAVSAISSDSAHPFSGYGLQ